MEVNKSHRYTLDNIFGVKDRGMYRYSYGMNNPKV